MTDWQDWRFIKCGCYNGITDHGEECTDCGGSGRLWVSRRDRVVKYPGGPFLGHWPGEFKKGWEIEP